MISTTDYIKTMLTEIKENHKKNLQRAYLLCWLEKKRDSYDLYSDKWLEYNNKYQKVLFNETK